MSTTEPGGYNPNAERENPYLSPEYKQSLEAAHPGSTQTPGRPLVASDAPLPVRQAPRMVQSAAPAINDDEMGDLLTLDDLRIQAQTYAQQGLHRYVDPDLGKPIYIKALTGAEVEKVNKLAGDKPGEFNKFLFMEGVKKPEIGLVEYQMFNRMSPGIKYRILEKIRELAGMDDEGLTKAKNALPEEDIDNSSGTV